MVRRAYKMMRKESGADLPTNGPRDVVSIREALEEMASARCPLCRMILVARMGRRGPGFYCRCPKRRAA